jgi:hypothetical protein
VSSIDPSPLTPTPAEDLAAKLAPLMVPAMKSIWWDAIKKLKPMKRVAATSAGFVLTPLLWFVGSEFVQAIIQAVLEYLINHWRKGLRGTIQIVQSQNAGAGLHSPEIDELSALLATPASRFHPAVREAMGIGENGEG